MLPCWDTTSLGNGHMTDTPPPAISLALPASLHTTVVSLHLLVSALVWLHFIHQSCVRVWAKQMDSLDLNLRRVTLPPIQVQAVWHSINGFTTGWGRHARFTVSDRCPVVHWNNLLIPCTSSIWPFGMPLLEAPVGHSIIGCRKHHLVFGVPLDIAACERSVPSLCKSEIDCSQSYDNCYKYTAKQSMKREMQLAN